MRAGTYRFNDMNILTWWTHNELKLFILYEDKEYIFPIESADFLYDQDLIQLSEHILIKSFVKENNSLVERTQLGKILKLNSLGENSFYYYVIKTYNEKYIKMILSEDNILKEMGLKLLIT